MTAAPDDEDAGAAAGGRAATLGIFGDRRDVADIVGAVDTVDEALRELGQRVRAGLDISSVDFAALSLLDRRTRQGRPTRVRDLTRQLGVSSATATMIAHRLEGVGLLRRERDEHDHRGTCLVLQPDAEERVARLLQPIRTEVAGLVGSIDPDRQRQLVDLLERFGTALRGGRA